jgi:hypothetical protein
LEVLILPRLPAPTPRRPPLVPPTAADALPIHRQRRSWVPSPRASPVDLEGSAATGGSRGRACCSERRRPPPSPALLCPTLQLAGGRLQAGCLHFARQPPMGPPGQRLESAGRSCRGSGRSCVFAASPRWNRARERVSRVIRGRSGFGRPFAQLRRKQLPKLCQRHPKAGQKTRNSLARSTRLLMA